MEKSSQFIILFRNSTNPFRVMFLIVCMCVDVYILCVYVSVIGPHLVNFELKAQFYNPGPNFLSAGDTQLPALYFFFFILFTVAL